MSVTKKYLLVLLIFILAAFSCLWFDQYYWQLVGKLYLLSTSNKIHFTGKPFHLFPNMYFLLSLSLFCSIITFLLINTSTKWWLLKIVITIVSFFIATAAISYIESNSYLIECTTCNDGTRKLSYGSIPYVKIFIESLTFSTMVFLVINRIFRSRVK